MKIIAMLAVGAIASTLVATGASGQIAGRLDHRALVASAPAPIEATVVRTDAFRSRMSSYYNDATATGGPSGGLPDRN